MKFNCSSVIFALLVVCILSGSAQSQLAGFLKPVTGVADGVAKVPVVVGDLTGAVGNTVKATVDAATGAVNTLVKGTVDATTGAVNTLVTGTTDALTGTVGSLTNIAGKVSK